MCDQLYEIALEENRFLQQHRRPTEAALLERKREALGRLEEALAAVRTAATGGGRDPEARAVLDKARSRILQVLQLDKENEQLLLRFSLSGGPATPSPPNAALLQRIYSRHP